jgi:hypothetical protein
MKIPVNTVFVKIESGSKDIPELPDAPNDTLSLAKSTEIISGKII